MDEIGDLEEQLEDILYELRGVYEQFDRVTNPPRGDERAAELLGKAYAVNFWLREINKVRERADPILERLSELDRELYANRQQILSRSTSDYRVLNEFSRGYPPFPDRFMEFNSRIEAIRRETLGSP